MTRYNANAGARCKEPFSQLDRGQSARQTLAFLDHPSYAYPLQWELYLSVAESVVIKGSKERRIASPQYLT